MPIIQIEIQSCKQCQFFKTANQWSTDGWDSMEDWVCSKHPENAAPKKEKGVVTSNTEKGKLIQGSVEWYEEKKISVPDWCPIKI